MVSALGLYENKSINWKYSILLSFTERHTDKWIVACSGFEVPILTLNIRLGYYKNNVALQNSHILFDMIWHENIRRKILADFQWILNTKK